MKESGTPMSFGFLAPLTLAAMALVATLSGVPPQPVFQSTIRIVDVRGAASLVARGASVLDGRESSAYVSGHLPGAQLYAWSLFTQAGSRRGVLRPDMDALASRFASLGVDQDRPTLVYGASSAGQGEEGHAAWLLALLGHADIAMLDGGIDAWRAAGRPVVTGTTGARAGRFVANVRPGLRVEQAELAQRTTQVLDVRTAAEFAGSTPWGESCGGHLPSARLMDWRELLDERGRFKPASQMRASLERAGVDPAAPLVALCSVGVRSAFVCAALAARGVSLVANYDGSMVEWSATEGAPITRTS